jgi:hypothetical protein
MVHGFYQSFANLTKIRGIYGKKTGGTSRRPPFQNTNLTNLNQLTQSKTIYL